MIVRLVLKKELLGILRDGRFAVLSLLGVLLLVIVVATSGQAHTRQSAERARIEALVREQWDHQGDKHPHRGAHYGLYAFRPDAPAMNIDPGIVAHAGRAIWLEPHRRNLPRQAAAADALPTSRIGELTPAFVLVTLFPLLIIASGFGSVSRERESGTLRMLHSAGVPPLALLAGKFAALFVAFGAILLLAAGAALALNPADLSPDGLRRAAILFAGLLLYYGCIAGIVVGVSALCRASLAALYLLLALWVVFAFVVPRAGAAAARALVPLPSAQAFWAGIHTDYTQGLPGDGDLAARGKRFDAELMRRHGVSRLDDLPVGAAPLRRLERDGYADKVHALHFSRLWEAFVDQEGIVGAASAFSPVLAMRNVSMKLAGTDLSHQQHFEEAAERYRQDVNRFIDEWDARSTRGLTSFESKYADDGLWQSVRPFDYQPPTVGFALRRAAADLAILCAWAAAALVLLVAAARRLTP